jgi:hypothetical protein
MSHAWFNAFLWSALNSGGVMFLPVGDIKASGHRLWANKGWDDTVYQQLKDIGIMSYFTRVD